jgi:hypothetical protein
MFGGGGSKMVALLVFLFSKDARPNYGVARCLFSMWTAYKGNGVAGKNLFHSKKNRTE